MCHLELAKRSKQVTHIDFSPLTVMPKFCCASRSSASPAPSPPGDFPLPAPVFANFAADFPLGVSLSPPASFTVLSAIVVFEDLSFGRHLVREGNAKLTKKVKHIGFNPLTAMPKFCCVFVEQFKLITKTFSRGK
ncbi:hypothetical protein GQX74_009706 [Glossina fuscipes]|nr:hypothetical protein GQX74_009706 [Glossina fuscipes]